MPSTARRRPPPSARPQLAERRVAHRERRALGGQGVAARNGVGVAVDADDPAARRSQHGAAVAAAAERRVDVEPAVLQPQSVQSFVEKDGPMRHAQLFHSPSYQQRSTAGRTGARSLKRDRRSWSRRHCRSPSATARLHCAITKIRPRDRRGRLSRRAAMFACRTRVGRRHRDRCFPTQPPSRSDQILQRSRATSAVSTIGLMALLANTDATRRQLKLRQAIGNAGPGSRAIRAASR